MPEALGAPQKADIEKWWPIVKAANIKGESSRPAFYTTWAAFFAPKEVIDKLNAAAVEALADPAMRFRLGNLGEEVFPPEQQTPEALGALVKADAEKWWPIIKELGIKAE